MKPFPLFLRFSGPERAASVSPSVYTRVVCGGPWRPAGGRNVAFYTLA